MSSHSVPLAMRTTGKVALRGAYMKGPRFHAGDVLELLLMTAKPSDSFVTERSLVFHSVQDTDFQFSARPWLEIKGGLSANNKSRLLSSYQEQEGRGRRHAPSESLLHYRLRLDGGYLDVLAIGFSITESDRIPRLKALKRGRGKTS